jgi:hypothetical protein
MGNGPGGSAGFLDYQSLLLEKLMAACNADADLTSIGGAGTYGVISVVALPPTENEDELEIYTAEMPYLGFRVSAFGPVVPIGGAVYMHPQRCRVYIAARKTPAAALTLVEQISNRVCYVLSRLNGSTIGTTSITQILLDSLNPSAAKVAPKDHDMVTASVVAVFNVLRFD